MSDYTINEIKIAAYNWNELPDMGVEERALWYSVGFWYEEYRSGRESKEDCAAAVNGLIEHYCKVKMIGRNK